MYVTYPGWSKSYNEWLPAQQIVTVQQPTETFTSDHSLQERSAILVHQLLVDIKRCLKLVRKESPRAIIRRDAQEDECELIFGLKKTPKDKRYKNNSDLSSIFGKNWMQRIDHSGNCSYVIAGTFCISLRKHRQVREYDSEGKEYLMTPGTYILLSYVRGDATKEQHLTSANLWQK